MVKLSKLLVLFTALALPAGTYPYIPDIPVGISGPQVEIVDSQADMDLLQEIDDVGDCSTDPEQSDEKSDIIDPEFLKKLGFILAQVGIAVVSAHCATAAMCWCFGAEECSLGHQHILGNPRLVRIASQLLGRLVFPYVGNLMLWQALGMAKDLKERVLGDDEHNTEENIHE